MDVNRQGNKRQVGVARTQAQARRPEDGSRAAGIRGEREAKPGAARSTKRRRSAV